MAQGLAAPDHNVAFDLLRTASSNCESVALWYGQGDTSWTYAQLAREAACAAAWLVEEGVRPGDRVAIVVGSWPEHIAAWYGVLAAGAIAVDVNYIVQDEEWRHVLTDSTPVALVGAAPFLSRLDALARDLGDLPILRAYDAGSGWRNDVTVKVDPTAFVMDRARDDVATISYTSGTTGMPKGVMHTHGAIGDELALLEEVQQYRFGDVLYQAVPLFAIHAFLPTAASAVRAGASIVLADRFDPVEMSRASHRFGITYMTLSTPMLDAIMRLPDDELPVFPKLRLLTAGGAPLQPEVRTRFEHLVGVPVTQGFGMTEIMGMVVADYEGDAPRGSCGRVRPVGSSDLVVLDDDGRALGPGEVGEFGVRRRKALAGYWGRPDLYRESFIGPWFRTGDIGKIDPNGFVYILDRKKDMIIRGGFNVYSAEIERVLSEHHGVAEATVVGVPDDRLGEVPVAFIVARDATVDRDELAADLLESTRVSLGSLKAPVWIRVVDPDELPRNTLRKVRKRELRNSLRRVG